MNFFNKEHLHQKLKPFTCKSFISSDGMIWNCSIQPVQHHSSQLNENIIEELDRCIVILLLKGQQQ